MFDRVYLVKSIAIFLPVRILVDSSFVSYYRFFVSRFLANPFLRFRLRSTFERSYRFVCALVSYRFRVTTVTSISSNIYDGYNGEHSSPFDSTIGFFGWFICTNNAIAVAS